MVNMFWGKKPASFLQGYKASTKKSSVKPKILLAAKLKGYPLLSGPWHPADVPLVPKADSRWTGQGVSDCHCPQFFHRWNLMAEDSFLLILGSVWVYVCVFS